MIEDNKQEPARKIGEIISASVQGGLDVKLELKSPENLKIGYPVIVEGTQYNFYCIVKDIINQPLDIAERIAGMKYRNDMIPVAAQEGYSGKVFYSKAELRPIQLIDKTNNELLEADTIPPYFSSVRLADEDDVDKIYKWTDSSMPIGTLRGLDKFNINIDFDKLTEKPFGIFGRTSAGKSILNKLICCGIVSKDIASVFVFDMQDEYGTYSRSDKLPGLKHFFPEKVELYSLDPNNREAHPFILSALEIEPDDLIISLHGLNDNMINALHEIYRKKTDDQGLIDAIIHSEPENFPEGKVHPSSLFALQRKVSYLDRFSFIKDIEGKKDVFNSIISNIKSKKSIVLQFGKYEKDSVAYLFIANILTRRFFDLYTDKNEDYPRLVIFLEEAHKFLKPGISESTIFNKLARETRKFNLILALVDQCPSEIDDEVRSQLANRLILSLKEPKDVSSSLAGLSDKSVWENIVTTMPPRTVVVVGDAIRVPTVINIMEYSEKNIAKHILNNTGKLTGSELDDIAKNASGIFK